MEKLLLGLALIFIVTSLWYVSLIKKRDTALEALAGIDSQLEKRTELMPTIVALAATVMLQEQALLTEMTQLSQQLSTPYNAKNPAEVKARLVQAERLQECMATFMLSVENYPELKSDMTLLQAMQNYHEVESHIPAARRFYNVAVTELNSAVEVFPGSIIANLASIKVMPFFEETESATPDTDDTEYL